MQKGKIFFNIIIIITIIALISLIGYIAYYYISNYFILKEAEQAVDEFENEVMIVAIEDEMQESTQNNVEQTTTTNKTTTSKTTKSYRGYSMIGTIQIPKTNVKVPIVDKVTTSSISAAVGVLYGPGLNEIGNTVLVAHNYRNRNFFF